MSSTINQKAYLQKYLAGPSAIKKKKKKKPVKGGGFKIIDDDIDLSKLRQLDGDELDILDMGEDAPQIAGIIDERPEDVKKQEQFKISSKWKIVNEDDGFNSKLQIEEIQKDVKHCEKDNELIFGKMYSDTEDEKNNDSDLSPPRKHNNDQKTASTNRNNDSDHSPPRRMESPKTKRKEQTVYDSDNSPPRKQDKQPKNRIRKPSRWGDFEKSNDTSPSRCDKSIPAHSRERSPRRTIQNGKNNNSDMSPSRKFKRDNYKEKAYDSDLSPPRKSKKDSHRDMTNDMDLSPPGKSKKDSHRKKGYDSDESLPRKSKHNTKRTKRRSDDSDLSPRRKHSKKRESLSPQRKSRKHSIDRKRKYNSDSDVSPPRRKKENSVSERDVRYRQSSNSPPPSNKKMAKTLEGKKAGLQDARQLRHENEDFRKKEEEVFSQMTDEVSGRNAQVVSRKGKRETSEERRKQRDKAEKQKELDEKYKKWSKGVKQIEAQEARIQDFMHEASKPLARHKDDRDLESRLKQVERDGDPMLQYMREKKRESGDLPPEKPIYKGNFPPNRFNVRPGYRWDGVDRSNGYEKKHFDHQSKKKAQEEEAYKWSTEDL